MVAAAVVAVATVGAGVISANASKHAAKTVADSQDRATQASNDLQREIYGKNTANLSPYMTRGNAAANEYSALLGLGGGGSPGGNVPSSIYGGSQGYGSAGYGGAGYGTGGAPGQVPNALNPNSAFDTYRNSTGYQFRYGQGENAVTQNMAVNGLLKSGSALKALTRYGQDYASNEFGNYMGYLSNQSGQGLSAANALAGVGTNYANAVSANNFTSADARSNAALAGAAGTNNMVNSALQGVGAFAGQYSSYKPTPFTYSAGAQYSPGWNATSSNYNFQGQY